MNILALDTSTNTLHLALLYNGEIEEKMLKCANQHSEILLHEIKTLLEKKNIDFSALDLLVCTKGPGAFTSLRIGLSTLKGISTALNIPIVSVSTSFLLYSLVSVFNYPTLTCIDAKKNRFYLSLYENGQQVIKDIDSNIENIKETLDSYDTILVTGPDSNKLNFENFKCKVLIDNEERALGAKLAKLGELQYKETGRDEIGSGPMYIRRSDAEEALLQKKREI